MDACPWASTFEKKTRAALGDAQGGSFSDGGSNPPASTRKQLAYLRLAVFLFIVDKFTVDDQKLLFTDNGSIYDYSTGVFVYQKKLSLSSGYIFCGHGRIAVARNTTDDVDFYDYDGNL